MPPSTHQAAVLPSPSSPLTTTTRPTPSPGPHDLLIQVKALALNPVDHYQRDSGIPPVPHHPYICGEDVSGLVISCGSAVPHPLPKGTRVLAFASGFYENGDDDHGAFQEYVLARWEGVVPLPEGVGFEAAAMLPLAVLTALSAYTSVGIPLGKRFAEGEREGILIWGASSSVGTWAVQSARAMGFVVYATCGEGNRGYVKGLGARETWDYKREDVVERIVERVKRDGVRLVTAHVVTQDCLGKVLDVLRETKGGEEARVAHSPLLKEDAPTLEGVTVKFVMLPLGVEERNEHIRKCFQGWLEPGLRSGTLVPSPRVRIVDGGLEKLNEALDVLKAGVSCEKVVVPI